MKGMNRVFLLGNVGGDPEKVVLKDGTTGSRFSMATNESKMTGKGQFEEVAMWHKINLFGSLAELANKYVKKGSKVLVEGKINYNKTQKSPDVPIVTYTSITGKGITLLDRPKESEMPE